MDCINIDVWFVTAEIRVLAVKAQNLGSVSGTQVVEGENQVLQSEL